MPLDIAALRTEFSTLHKQAGDLISAASKEGRDLTAEEKQTKDRLFARMDRIQADVKDEERLAAYEFAKADVTVPTDPKGKTEFGKERGGPTGIGPDGKIDLNAYRDAVNHYARTGDASKVQKFATTTGTETGVLVPKQVLTPVTVRRTSNPFRDLLSAYGLKALSIDTSATVSLPVDDDTANTGATQAEGANAANADTDPDRSNSLTLNGNTLYSSKPAWYSNTLIGSLGFDVFSYSLPILQKRNQKKQESAWTTKLIAETVGVTLAASNAITYAEWINFEHALSVAYRTDCGYLLHDNLLKLLRGLVDDNHRPIVLVDTANGGMSYTINNRPVFIGEYMEDFGLSKIVGAAVSAEAVKVMDAMQARLARYVSQPGRPDQIGFELFENADCDFVPQGVRLLKTAAA